MSDQTDPADQAPDPTERFEWTLDDIELDEDQPTDQAPPIE